MNAGSVRLSALLLLTVAVTFRLWVLPQARFTGDESDYWFKSRQVAVGQYRPVYGPEITGSAARLPGPAYYYLMAIPQALGASPYFGSAFVALLHGLMAWLLFALTRQARGARAGLFALALVMFAPWDVLYGDRIWGSCLVPVWGCLTIYAVVQSREQPAWLGGALWLALVLPQLHLSVPVLWVAAAVLLVLRPPPRWPWRALAAGFALAVLAYGAPLAAELSSGFSNTRLIWARGGGQLPWPEALWAPVKVFGYAILYGTSEIGYHWARGYWGGGFSEAAAYFSAEGLNKWWVQHGPVLAFGHLVSVTCAGLGWGIGIGHAARDLHRRERPVCLGTALTLALVAGLTTGAILLAIARKGYFPHYANILMPFILAPIAFGLDIAARRAKLLVPVALAISVVAMAVGTARYYRDVDRLNGLAATLSMVARVVDEPGPARIRFTHFQNGYAWHKVAQGVFGRPLPPAGGSTLYTVHNHAPFKGSRPKGGTLHGSVLLTRRPPVDTDAAQPKRDPNLDWRTVHIEAEHPDGQRRACRPASGPCRYGSQPWQKFEPTTLVVGGRPRSLLFLHPVQDGVVRARIAVPAHARTAILMFALSDAATQSSNTTPVEVSVVDAAGRALGHGQAGNRPGLQRIAWSVPPGQNTVTVELRCRKDGARVFGFDVRFLASDADEVDPAP